MCDSLLYFDTCAMHFHALRLVHRRLFYAKELGSGDGLGTWSAMALFPSSLAWVEKREPGTHCLRMLSFFRISKNLQISIKSTPLH